MIFCQKFQEISLADYAYALPQFHVLSVLSALFSRFSCSLSSPVLSVLLSSLFSQFSRPPCSLCSPILSVLLFSLFSCSPSLSVLLFSQFSRLLCSSVLSVLLFSQFSKTGKLVAVNTEKLSSLAAISGECNNHAFFYLCACSRIVKYIANVGQ